MDWVVLGRTARACGSAVAGLEMSCVYGVGAGGVVGRRAAGQRVRGLPVGTRCVAGGAHHRIRRHDHPGVCEREREKERERELIRPPLSTMDARQIHSS